EKRQEELRPKKTDRAKAARQPYIAEMMRGFKPSVARFAALAKTVRCAPSILALMAEVLLHANGGRLPGEGAPAESVYEAFGATLESYEKKSAGKEKSPCVREIFAPWASEKGAPVHVSF